MKLWLLSIVLGHLCLSTCIQGAREDWPELILDERVLRIFAIAVDLSVLAYANATEIEEWVVDFNETSGLATFEHPDYDEIEFFTEEPDQAIIAKKEGRCYLAFRGTIVSIEDWLQNAGLGSATIFKDNIDTGNLEDSCEARGGFADFLSSGSVARGRADLQICVDSCEDPDDCLVITGHSQGGAIASIAAITLYSLKPTVVTFGQPPSLDPGCPFINNSTFYRFVNWLQDPGEYNDLGFDLVVYAPTWISGSDHYGYNILVGEDPSNVYLGGYGNDVEFYPNRADNKIAAHSMSGTNYSYQSRIYALYDNFPDVGSDGSVEGTVCEDSYMELCRSGSCVENKCTPFEGVNETCIKRSCKSDADCVGDLVCVWYSCADRQGEVQPGCPCGNSSDCFNQNCTTLSTLNLDNVCNPDVPNIPKVNETCIPDSCEEDTDCAADLVCIYGACATGSGEVQAGCPCKLSSECANGNCISVGGSAVDFVCKPDESTNGGTSLIYVWSTLTAAIVHFLVL